MASHHVLYAGDDIYLADRLKDPLRASDCSVVRSPVPPARTLIWSGIEYSLFLFDETEAGAELEAYARALTHRERTPVIFVKQSDRLSGLLEAIRRRLRQSERR
jgi:glutaredoxin